MSSRRRAAPTRRRSMSWRKASAAPAGLWADVAAAEGRDVAVGEAGEAAGSGNGERALERRVAAGDFPGRSWPLCRGDGRGRQPRVANASLGTPIVYSGAPTHIPPRERDGISMEIRQA